MSQITDDLGNSIELGRVLYDLSIGKYVRLTRDDDMVVEIDVLSGNTIHEFDYDEFVEEGLGDDFRDIPEIVVENPERVLNEVMDALLSDNFDSLAGYEPWEVRFAWARSELNPVELQ